MSDYLEAKVNLPTSGTANNNQIDGSTLLVESDIYTQGIVSSVPMIKVDDTPYVPPEKITVRKYRLYKTKEAQ